MTTEKVISDCLVILESIKEDNSIESYQYRDHTPQNMQINDKSTIIIDVNTTNTYILPSDSYLIIQGQLRKNIANHDAYNAADEVALVNNAMMYLFKEISYSINDTEMERIVNPGQTTSIFGYLKYPDDFSTSSALGICWSKDTTNHANSSKYEASAAVTKDGIAAGALTPRENSEYNQGFAARKSLLMSADPRGSFEFAIPFSHIFGFAEYNKVIWGMKHTLRITPHPTDNLAIHKGAGVADGEVILKKVSWSIPDVKIEPVTLTKLRSVMESKQPIPVAFRARTTQSISIPRDSTQFDWRLSVPGGVEKPRWIIVGFQTDKNTTQEQNPAVFDNLSLSNFYLELNSKRYPTYDISVNFATNSYSKLYNMFNNFKNEYYGFDSLVGGTQVNFSTFKTLYPIIVFDVRKQDEELKSGVVDIQLTFKFNQAVPANTMAYACIVSDRMFKFQPDGTNITVKSY